MSRQDANAAFARASFLYGGNAQFIEQLYAKFLENRASVSQHWQQFFAGLEDNAEEAKRHVEGPSWQRSDWPPTPSGELVSAFDGNWPAAKARGGVDHGS